MTLENKLGITQWLLSMLRMSAKWTQESILQEKVGK